MNSKQLFCYSEVFPENTYFITCSGLFVYPKDYAYPKDNCLKNIFSTKKKALAFGRRQIFLWTSQGVFDEYMQWMDFVSIISGSKTDIPENDRFLWKLS